MLGPRIVRYGCVIIGVVMVLWVALLYNAEGRYRQCDKISEWLNAKSVAYQGKTYRVMLCGDGAGIKGNLESVKLSVYAPDGGLVAVRRFSVDFLGTVYPLKYKPKGIEYLDDDKGFVIIPLPPTREDWIKARIPAISGS